MPKNSPHDIIYEVVIVFLTRTATNFLSPNCHKKPIFGIFLTSLLGLGDWGWTWLSCDEVSTTKKYLWKLACHHAWLQNSMLLSCFKYRNEKKETLKQTKGLPLRKSCILIVLIILAGGPRWPSGILIGLSWRRDRFDPGCRLWVYISNHWSLRGIKLLDSSAIT